MTYIAQATPIGTQVKEYDGHAAWPIFKIFDHKPTDAELDTLQESQEKMDK